mmetsp:Transcript_26736/g.70227  ORF Transcript_26736/g.70227 Transcript_26736/m.70227 type:complete len:231 (-) Transcript_26736:249-941(-)
MLTPTRIHPPSVLGRRRGFLERCSLRQLQAGTRPCLHKPPQAAREAASPRLWIAHHCFKARRHCCTSCSHLLLLTARSLKSGVRGSLARRAPSSLRSVKNWYSLADFIVATDFCRFSRRCCQSSSEASGGNVLTSDASPSAAGASSGFDRFSGGDEVLAVSRRLCFPLGCELADDGWPKKQGSKRVGTKVGASALKGFLALETRALVRNAKSVCDFSRSSALSCSVGAEP